MWSSRYPGTLVLFISFGLATLASCTSGDPVCVEVRTPTNLPNGIPEVKLARDYLSKHPLKFRGTPSDPTKVSFPGGGLANTQATWAIAEQLGAATKVGHKLSCPYDNCPPVNIICPADRVEAVPQVSISWSPTGASDTLSQAKTWVGPTLTFLPKGETEDPNNTSTHFAGLQVAKDQLNFEFTGRTCDPGSKLIRWHLQYNQEGRAQARLYAVAQCTSDQSSEMEEVELLIYSASS